MCGDGGGENHAWVHGSSECPWEDLGAEVSRKQHCPSRESHATATAIRHSHAVVDGLVSQQRKVTRCQRLNRSSSSTGSTHCHQQAAATHNSKIHDSKIHNSSSSSSSSTHPRWHPPTHPPTHPAGSVVLKSHGGHGCRLGGGPDRPPGLFQGTANTAAAALTAGAVATCAVLMVVVAHG